LRLANGGFGRADIIDEDDFDGDARVVACAFMDLDEVLIDIPALLEVSSSDVNCLPFRPGVPVPIILAIRTCAPDDDVTVAVIERIPCCEIALGMASNF
jgi:hypothetical protein